MNEKTPIAFMEPSYVPFDVNSFDDKVRYQVRLEQYCNRLHQVQIGTLWMHCAHAGMYRIKDLTINEEDKHVLIHYSNGNEFAVGGILYDTWTLPLDIFLERFYRVYERTIA